MEGGVLMIIIMGVMTFFDLMIIKWKFENSRFADAIFDVSSFMIILTFFHGSIILILVGMVAQFLVSIYLLIKPPKFDFLKNLLKDF